MHVFIYRHAQAEDAEPDEARKLTARGKKQAEVLAKHLPADVFADVSEVWHSPLVRAEQTAKAFCKHTPALKGVGIHTVYELEPEADIMAMARLLGECEGDVIAVGHNPFLEKLVTALCSGEVGDGLIELKKGAMVCLERTVEASANIPAGLWTLKWYITPKLAGLK